MKSLGNLLRGLCSALIAAAPLHARAAPPREGSLYQAPAPGIDVAFSSLCRVDTSHFNDHDPKNLFYFNLYCPGPPGTPDLVFPLHAQGDTQFKVWLDPKLPPNQKNSPAARSLGIQITSNVNQPKKDKIVFALVPVEDAKHLSADAPDNRRYVAFDFMLDPKYEKPTAWVMHFQAWQCCGGHPPFTMEVLPGHDPAGPIDATFGIRDDAAENRRDHPRTVLAGVRLKRGEWYNIVFQLEPQSDSSSRPGTLAMWLDGKKRFNYTGHWGYQPMETRVRDHLVHDQFSIELGIYRQRQTTTQTIYFQNLRYGKDLASVAPQLAGNTQ
jgi:hypothetical protein